MRARRRPSPAGPVLCLLGGGVMVAGAFLPFLPGWAGYRTPDGALSIGVGMVIAMLSLASSRATSRFPAVLTAVLGVLGLGAAAVDVLGAAAPGPGLFVVGGGALLATAGALAGMPRTIRRHTRGSR